MTYNTHLYLGSVLYPVICENWNANINRKRFLYGCVKPDICSLFIRHPHFWRISHKYIFKKIRKLSRRQIGSDRRNRKFSEELGIILHYVADFFTSVHNITPNRLQQHIKFENRLYADFCAWISEETVRNYFQFLRAESVPENGLRDILKTLHKANQPEPANTSYDIREILFACVTVTCGIMNAATAAPAIPAEGPESGMEPVREIAEGTAFA